MANVSSIKLPNNTTYNIVDKTSGYTKNTGTITKVQTTAGAHTTINVSSGAATFSVPTTAAHVGAIPTNTNGNTQNLLRPLQLNGLGDVTLDAKINTLRANRLAFLPAEQIIIEKTTDGGSTWTDAGVADSTKVGLFSETRAGVYIPLLNGVKNINCGLRITITGMKYNVPSGTAETSKYNYWNSDHVITTERYNQLKEMYFWVSSNSDSIGVKVERATGAASTNWITIFDNTNYGLTGWSGNDYIRFSQSVFGGGSNQTSNYWNYRLTFFTRGPGGSTTLSGTNTTSAQSIMEIRGYGDTWWNAGNEYAANDHLYTHDYLKNATFPAKVTATSFSGPLTGNVTGNVSGTASNVTGTVAIANGGTGQTTAANAINALLNGLPTWTADPTDTTYFIRQDTGGSATYGKVQATTLWNYISGKLPSWSKASTKPSYNFSEIGSTPTTLSGYGITDAKIASGVITLGSNTITPLTSSSTLSAAKLSGAIPSTVTATTQASTDNSTKIATTAYVTTAIANLPEPMLFKGSVGTGGTVTSLPTAAAANEGWTYKVITALATPVTAEVGDTVISNGSAWIVIPSGDEPSGTVTSVGLSNATNGGLTISGGPITSSGSITVGHTNVLTSAQTTEAIYPIKIDKNGHISAYGSAVTPLTASSTLDATKLSGTIPSNCYTDTNTTYTLSNALSSHKFTSTLTAGGSGSGTSTATMEFVAGTGITLTDDTTNKKITIASSVTNTDEKLRLVTVKSGTTYYPIVGKGPDAATRQYDDNGFQYTGTFKSSDYTNYQGYANITLGNSNVTGTAYNQKGVINLYSNTAYSAAIHSTDLTDDRSILLPDKSGTVALTNDIPDVSGKIDTAGTGLSKSGTTLNHSNSVTAQTTQAVYPIKIDAQGHISAYGNAVTIPTIPSNNVTGSGSTDYLARWSGTNTLSSSHLSTSTSYNSSSDLYGKAKFYIGDTGQIDWQGQLVFYSGNLSKTITVTPPSLTTKSRTLTLPDASGTIALTSDIPTISYPVTSVNSKTGAVTLTASEVGALPDTTPIPSKTSDLTNDSGFTTKNMWYGTCSTGASTAAKAVTTSSGDFTLTTGSMVRVKFTSSNSYDGTATLNVDGKGAKNITKVGANTTTQYYWVSGEVVDFVYDGTNFVMSGKGTASVTYYGLTKLSSATDSTSVTLAATPKAVKTAYDLANSKQAELVSGTNIKTINNTSLLGSGDISVAADGTPIPTASEVAEFDTNAHMNSTDMTSSEIEDFVEDLDMGASGLLNMFYPVGSYYETSDSTFDPNVRWGGTWVLETEGQVHVSAGVNYEIGDTGGEAEVTLTTGEIPTHTHGSKSLTGTLTSRRQGADYVSIWGSGIVSISVGGANVTSNSVGTSNKHADIATIDATHEHDSVGDGGAHNNMPPYVVVNRWHRTA